MRRKEYITINQMFVIDYEVLRDLKANDRKFPFMLNPVNPADFEGGKLKLKEGMKMIRIGRMEKVDVKKTACKPTPTVMFRPTSNATLKDFS